MLPPALLLLLAAPSARAQVTLTAGGGISLTINTGDAPQTAQQGFGYSVKVDGADWLASGPTAMTVGGKTYTSGSGCASTESCLEVDGKLTKTSGTDVRPTPFSPDARHFVLGAAQLVR
eukprot:SAG31_NODE_16013_length_727_cov_1.197452_1_plen_119_part_00